MAEILKVGLCISVGCRRLRKVVLYGLVPAAGREVSPAGKVVREVGLPKVEELILCKLAGRSLKQGKTG